MRIFSLKAFSIFLPSKFSSDCNSLEKYICGWMTSISDIERVIGIRGECQFLLPRTHHLRFESDSKSHHLLGKSCAETKRERLKEGALSRTLILAWYIRNYARLGRLVLSFPRVRHALSLPSARNNKFRSSGGGGGRVNCNLSVSCSAGDEWSYHLCMFSPLRTITSPSPCRTHLHTTTRERASDQI